MSRSTIAVAVLALAAFALAGLVANAAASWRGSGRPDLSVAVTAEMTAGAGAAAAWEGLTGRSGID